MRRQATRLVVNLKLSATQTASAERQTTTGKIIKEWAPHDGKAFAKPNAPGCLVGIRPCDGIDKGTHYCCIAPGNGIASDACCRNSSNLFVLGHSIPTVVAQMPLSQITSAMGTATAALADGSEGDNTSSGGGGSSTTTIGLGVGLGVGLPLSIAVAGVIWLIGKKCRRNQGAEGAIGPVYDEGTSRTANPDGPGAGLPAAAAGPTTVPPGGLTEARHTRGHHTPGGSGTFPSAG